MAATHAHAPDDKEARRRAILAAARDLFNAGDGTLPAAASIAAAAGLAKGTVYLYFRTKEEIFIALLLQGCLDVMGEIETAFTATKGRRGDKVTAFLRAYVGHVVRHPELTRLDAICYGVLEKNLEPAKLRAFKTAFGARLAQAALVIEQALRLPTGQGTRLLMRSFALTRGLWQTSSPGEPAIAESDPHLALLHPPFEAELMDALTEYWRGALNS